MSPRSPYSSEGHPGLPATDRLVWESPPRWIASETDLRVARLRGHGLEALDVRDGDRLLIAPGRKAEHGDLAALRLPGERASTLWKVYPERDHLRLSTGRASHAAPADAVVEGVVVGILRKLESD